MFINEQAPTGFDTDFSVLTDGLPLNIPNPDTSNTADAEVRVVIRGGTDLDSGESNNLNDHKVQFFINGNDLGVAEWDGFNEIVYTANFPHNWLVDGDNKFELLRLDPENGLPSNQRLDRIEIDYARLPVAQDDQLWLHDAVAGSQVVSGFSDSSILVIENPDRNSPRVLENVTIQPQGGGYQVVFRAREGRDYLVADTAAASNIASSNIDFPSTLTRRSNRADYLIISPREFAQTANDLKDFRENRFGNVRIAWLDDIYDVFSFGRVDPFAITRFMDFVDRRWRIAPSNVIIIGNGTLDHKGRMAVADSFVPILMATTPFGIAPSDTRLLTGGVDPTYAIGRLPIWTEAEGIAYVSKLVDQENNILSHSNAVVIADNPDKAGDFHSNMDDFAEELVTTYNLDLVTGVYHAHPEPGNLDNLVPLQKNFSSVDPSNPVNSVIPSLNSALTESETWAAKLVTYDGHGSSFVLAAEVFMTLADAEAIDVNNPDEVANPDLPQGIFSALSCTVGDFTIPGVHSFANQLVLGNGAIAAMSPTGLSLDIDAQALNSVFVDRLLGENMTVGEATMQAINTADMNDFMRQIYTVIGDPAAYAM